MSDSWYVNGGRAVDDAMKEEILARLLKLWKEHPDLRFMQLLGNVFRWDAYYFEDYNAIRELEGFYQHVKESWEEAASRSENPGQLDGENLVPPGHPVKES